MTRSQGNPPEQTLVTGNITALAFGGKGIIRQDNFVIFVPYTAIGDEVVVRLTKKKKAYAEAVLVEIKKPSPDRTLPLCSYFGHCGGCQLQHLQYAAQLSHKKQCVEDALKRIGHLSLNVPITIAPALPHWHYRRQIHLTLSPFEEGYRAGYIATDNQTVLSITECPIFIEKSDSLLTEVQELVKAFKRQDDLVGKMSILKINPEVASDDGYVLSFHFEKKAPSNAPSLLRKRLSQLPHWKGIVLKSENKFETFGEPQFEIEIDNLRILMSLGTFLQNHWEQSLAIYRSIIAIVTQFSIKSVLDLYCGIGILSLMMGKEGIRVKGVENNAKAITIARQNVIVNFLNGLSFIESDVESLISKLLFEEKADAIVLNPPRIGLHPTVIAEILKHPPPLLIYVSCMPATLARDLKEFSVSYAIEKCEAFDMFPQTAHVETLVVLKRKKIGKFA